MPLSEVYIHKYNRTAPIYSQPIDLPIAFVPIPGKLAGGFSYVFSAIIDGNSVSFPNVSIKDWTEVDESGNPLYPTQK